MRGPDGRTATGFFPCDSCAPSEVDKLRLQNAKLLELTMDIRASYNKAHHRAESGRHNLAMAMVNIRDLCDEGLKR